MESETAIFVVIWRNVARNHNYLFNQTLPHYKYIFHGRSSLKNSKSHSVQNCISRAYSLRYRLSTVECAEFYFARSSSRNAGHFFACAKVGETIFV